MRVIFVVLRSSGNYSYCGSCGSHRGNHAHVTSGSIDVITVSRSDVYIPYCILDCLAGRSKHL